VNNDLNFTAKVRQIPIVGPYLQYKFQLVVSVLLMFATSTFYAVSGIATPIDNAEYDRTQKKDCVERQAVDLSRSLLVYRRRSCDTCCCPVTNLILYAS